MKRSDQIPEMEFDIFLLLYKMSIRATRKQRMTKNDVNNFINWCFSDDVVNLIADYSCGKIAEEYFKATGITVSTQFVGLQRKKWIKLEPN